MAGKYSLSDACIGARAMLREEKRPFLKALCKKRNLHNFLLAKCGRV